MDTAALENPASKAEMAPGSAPASASKPAKPAATRNPVAAKAPAKKAVVKKPVVASAPAAKPAGKVAKPVPKPVAKPAGKPAAKPVAKPATKVVAKAASKVAPKLAAKPAPAKEVKTRKPVVKKPKLIRDSFTFPESDYALIAVLKQRAVAGGREIKKSEVLRAGLAALSALPEAELLKALDSVERIKTGRPSK